MKDALGHGSGYVTPQGRGIMPSRPFRESIGHQTAIASSHGVGTGHLYSASERAAITGNRGTPAATIANVLAATGR